MTTFEVDHSQTKGIQKPLRLSILAQLLSLPIPQCSVFFAPPSDENGYYATHVFEKYVMFAIITITVKGR